MTVRAGKVLRAFVVLAVFLSPAASRCSAAVLLHEDFSGTWSSGHPSGSLPFRWGVGPSAHAHFIATSRDTATFGLAAPSLHVDLPPHTLNYRVASPAIALPAADSVLTLQVSMKLDMPDSPFLVEGFFLDQNGNALPGSILLDLPGEQMTGFRTYRVSFTNPGVGQTGCTCVLYFGLSFYKTFRQGQFWIDDVEVREGRETGDFQMYVTPESVPAGGTVSVHLSCAAGQASLMVYREAGSQVPVLGPIQASGLSAQPIPDEAWKVGCGWPVAATVSTGADWPSGDYTIRADDGNRTVISSFVVSGRGGDGRVLVILPTHTWQAYNGWDGWSFYTGPAASELTFERPFTYSLLGPYTGTVLILRWLSRQGIPYAVFSETDLNDHPELLFRYPGVMLTGHSEYWTRTMRRAFETYFDAGGSILSLSGNTCWWQTRFEDAGNGQRHLICYKYSADQDPDQQTDPTLVTTRWDEPPVNDPPSRLFGLSWRYGGLINWSSSSSCPCPYDWLEGHGGYRVYHPEHWVFAGTGFAQGDSLGREDAMVGYEVDGAPLFWKNGIPGIDPSGGSPPGFQVLGYAMAYNDLKFDSSGVALMGIVERGSSFLFNGGSLGWCWGMARDTGVQKVTLNLIDHLPAGGPVPQSSPDLIHVVPVPAVNSVSILVPVPGQLPSPSAMPQVGIFSVDGRCLANLPSQWYSPLRAWVNWDFRDQEGKSVPAGVYWVRVPGATARVVRVK